MSTPARFRVRLVAALLILATFACTDSDSGKRKKDQQPNPDAYELNNTLATCRFIAVDPVNGFFNDDLTLHNGFDEDFYCFSASEPSTLIFSVGFKHADGNIDIGLLDGSGLPIDTSATQQDVELIIRNVQAGSFIVRVYSPVQRANAYAMEIHLQTAGGPCMPDFLEPNDDAANAKDMGNVAFNPYVDAGLNICDTPQGPDEDWFVAVIPQAHTFDAEILFFPSQGALEIELLDVNLNVIASSAVGRITSVQPAGTYFLRVFSPTSEENEYLIQVTAF